MLPRRLSLAALLPCLFAVVAAIAAKAEPGVTVGWHDELDETREWTSFPPPNEVEKLTPRSGGMRLRIPLTDTPESAPPFHWGTVHRTVEVDLDRYPVLAVRTLRRSRDTWWDCMVQEVREGQLVGNEYKTASLRKASLILYDLPRETGLTGKKQLRLRLNVARVKRGCWVDYDYVRFVSREDAQVLRRNPNFQPVVQRP